MNITNYFLIALSAIIFTSCANQNAVIMGGPKDVDPPKVVKSIPQDKTVNFTGNKVEITFDEPIEVGSSTEDIYIVPTLKTMPKIKTGKKFVTLEFIEPLAPNTTYTINFVNAIKDLTERNPIQQLSLTFSTGPVIDSLTIKGNVKNLWTNKPESKILIGLYKTSDTSDILNSAPLYLGYSNETGDYTIDYIKEETYNLYALKEDNKTLKYDEPKELLGFIKSLKIEKDTSKINLVVAKIDTISPKIIETINRTNIYTITFTEGVNNLKLESTTQLPFKVHQKKNKIDIYNTNQITDSINIRINGEDSLRNKLELNHTFAFKPLGKNETNLPPINQIRPESGINPFKPEFSLEFNYPIKQTITPLTFLKNSKEIKLKEQWEQNNTILKYQLPVNQDDTLKVIIPDSTFITDFKVKNNPDTLTYIVTSESEFGSIEGKVLHDDKNFQIQLLNTNYEVIDFINNKDEIKFTGIQPGDYFIRVVIDVNKNGIWDQPDPSNNLQPEPVIYHKDQIKVKANWEIKGIEIRL